MGNQQASENNLSLTSQQREDWIKVEDQGYCQLWANKKTNKRFQAYPISDAAAKDNVQLEKYAFRKIHNAFLVSAEAVISQSQTFLCSVPSTSFVLIQNIVNRLKSFPNSLTFQEALYVLSSSASGYNTLCSFFGPLEPNEDMICFNDSGNVKVWLNENLSKNQASPNARSVELEMPKMDDCNFAERRSRQCVEKLLKIVEISSIQGFPRAFKDETKKLSTFFEISNFVDYFCVQNNIKIFDHIQLKRNQTVISGPPPQIQMVSSAAPIPGRLQSAPSLQSSRVKQVFQSNHHQRQGMPPAFIPQINQTYIANPQFRPPLPPQVPQVGPSSRIQNHQISYVVSPVFHPPIINPTIVISNPSISSLPVPQNSVQIKVNSIKRVELPQETIRSIEVVKVKAQFIQQLKGEVLQQKFPQIISTPEEPQEIALPAQGSLDKYQVRQSQTEQPQFNESDIGHNQEIIQANSQVPHQYVHLQYDSYQSHQPKEDGQAVEKIECHYEPQINGNYGYQHSLVQQTEQPNYQSKSVQQIQRQQPQNVYQQEYYEEQYHQERQPNGQSVYSNIEQYVPPPHAAFIQSIEERKQEQIISPQKQNQIDEWSQKLDSFTHSKEKHHSKIQILKPVHNEVIVQTKEPESFKNLIVSDKKEQYVNELADLENDDIEKYIRMKYQAYLKEQNQSSAANTIQYRKQPEQEIYRPKYQSYKSNQYQQPQEKVDYNDYYQQTSYGYKNPLVWQTSQGVQRKQASGYQPYQASIYPSNTNRISIEKDFQQDYAPSSRNEPSSYGYRYENQTQDNYSKQYQRPYASGNRQPERRNSNRNSNNIDQKYSKYVLNSQKPKRAAYNVNSINSEDVSLILPGQQSNFLRKTPNAIIEKSFDNDSFSKNRPSAKKGITYENLRNLLWEE